MGRSRAKRAPQAGFSRSRARLRDGELGDDRRLGHERRTLLAALAADRLGRGVARPLHERLPADRARAAHRTRAGAPAVKYQIVRRLQRYLINPPVRALFALGLAPPFYGLLETTGRS